MYICMHTVILKENITFINFINDALNYKKIQIQINSAFVSFLYFLNRKNIYFLKNSDKISLRLPEHTVLNI